MPTIQQLQVRRGDVLVLVGTMKGLFVFRSPPDRARFEMGGPYFPGHSVYAAAYDSRAERDRIWAAASSISWLIMVARTSSAPRKIPGNTRAFVTTL